VRPDVVWFGELLPRDKLAQAEQVIQTTDLMLVIGTSGVVSPAAEMPYFAKQQGAMIIEVNPQRSEITPLADVWLEAPSGEALPQLLAALEVAE
jgi:NAD-dependent deacetylase